MFAGASIVSGSSFLTMQNPASMIGGPTFVCRIISVDCSFFVLEQFQKANYAASELEKLHFTFISLGDEVEKSNNITKARPLPDHHLHSIQRGHLSTL